VAKVTRFLYMRVLLGAMERRLPEFRGENGGSQGRIMAHNVRRLAALALIGGFAAGGIALARGPDMNLQIFAPSTEPSFSFEPTHPARASLEDGAAPVVPQHHKHSTGGHGAFGYGKPVCVRLCDGFFFPTTTTTGGDAACAAQCPDAPTALYTMPGEHIEDAVSMTGKPYTQLPVAKHYQTSFENTCTCHRDNIASRAKEILHDSTLRKGDVVMTADGFKVYEGNGYGAATQRDFVAVSHAGSVSKEERATLAAMERASAGSPPPASPALAVARPHGNVTVDNGEPAPAQ
jgi:Protein of unknown function (DUF2865)